MTGVGKESVSACVICPPAKCPSETPLFRLFCYASLDLNSLLASLRAIQQRKILYQIAGIDGSGPRTIIYERRERHIQIILTSLLYCIFLDLGQHVSDRQISWPVTPDPSGDAEIKDADGQLWRDIAAPCGAWADPGSGAGAESGTHIPHCVDASGRAHYNTFRIILLTTFPDGTHDAHYTQP